MKSRYRYVYEYTSPFGENWRVDKLWFGFLWLTHSRPYSINVYDYKGIENYIDNLITDSIEKQRKLKINKIINKIWIQNGM